MNSKISLTTKILSLLILMFAMASINVVVVYDYFKTQKHDTHIVNIAGRQRMLTQKMAKLALSIANGNDKDRSALSEIVMLYENSLSTLWYGGEVMGSFIPPATMETHDLFVENEQIWRLFKEQALIIAKEKRENSTFSFALAYMKGRSEQFSKICNDVVSAYENLSQPGKYSHEINVAGRQRMLLQMIMKNIFLVSTGDEDGRRNLKETIELFDASQEILFHGGLSTPWGKKVSEPPLAVRKALKEVDEEWVIFKRKAYLIQSEFRDNAEFNAAVRYVSQNDGVLLDISDRVTGEFDLIFSDKVLGLKIMIVILMAVNLLILIIGYLLNIKIIRPLKELSIIAAKVGSGDLTAKIERFPNDEIGELAASFNDMVDNLNSSQEKLLFAKNYTNNILKSMIDPLVVLDFDGVIRTVNSATLDLLGFKEGELTGKPLNIFFQKEDDFSEKMGLQSLMKNGEIGNLKKKSKEKIPVNMHVSTMQDENGKLIGLVCVARDMRQIIELVEALDKAKASLEEWSETLEKKVSERTEELTKSKETILKVMEDVKREKERAEIASESKSRFLATMSHEIRTPLNAILGMADLLFETEINSRQAEYLSVLTSSGEALLSIINDVLDLSKIEAGHLELEKVEFDGHKLIEQVFKIISVSAREKSLNVKWHIDDNVPAKLVGDLARLRQILLNLLGNAVKFTEKGVVRIDVSTTVLPRYPNDNLSSFAPGDKSSSQPVIDNDSESLTLWFYVSDTGIGIEKEKLDLIFDSFKQADLSDTRRYGGTGLGLTISKYLVELMGGTIFVKSEPRKGSTFIFSARFEAAEPDLSVIAQEEDKSGTICVDRKGLRILVVDDVDDNCFLIRNYLRNSSYEIDIAENGKIAFELFKKEEYSLVLMDIEMPVMDGYSATKQIRKWEKENKINATPIIALTAHAFKEVQDKCLRVGMNNSLTKPIRKSDLFEIMDRLMPSSQLNSKKEEGRTKKGSNIEKMENKFFNEPLVMSCTDGDLDLLYDLLEALVKNLPQYMSEIERAVKDGNAEKLRKAAHRLKGPLLIYCTDTIISELEKLLTMAAKGKLDSAGESFTLLKNYIRQLKKEIKRMLKKLKKQQILT